MEPQPVKLVNGLVPVPLVRFLMNLKYKILKLVTVLSTIIEKGQFLVVTERLISGFVVQQMLIMKSINQVASFIILDYMRTLQKIKFQGSSWIRRK